MATVALLFVSAVLWQEQFADGISSMKQLYDYTVDICHEDDMVLLRACPEENEFAAAWYCVDETIPFPDDALVRLTVKVTAGEARVRFFCRRHGHSVYYADESVVTVSEQWQTIDMKLQDAKPFYSSNFPASLAPGSAPALFLIIESMAPGPFAVAIDDILIVEPKEAP